MSDFIPLPSDGSTDKLTIKVPIKGATNWDETLKDDTFDVIANHDHSGDGNGAKVSVQSLKERGNIDLSVDSSFTDIASVLDLASTAGRGSSIEYCIKRTSDSATQKGTLTIFYKDASNLGVADEFIGADLEVDFQLTSGAVFQYKAAAASTLYYYVNTVGVT